jgi:hypothetical protein
LRSLTAQCHMAMQPYTVTVSSLWCDSCVG